MIKKLHNSDGHARLFFTDGSYLPVRICEVEQHFREPTKFTGHVLDCMTQGIHADTKLVGGDPFDIRDVIFNDPATIVLWADGTKTVVKCQEDDTYSPEVGLALCFAKKALGNKGNFNNIFKKWIPEEKPDIQFDTSVLFGDGRSLAHEVMQKFKDALNKNRQLGAETV